MGCGLSGVGRDSVHRPGWGHRAARPRRGQAGALSAPRTVAWPHRCAGPASGLPSTCPDWERRHHRRYIRQAHQCRCTVRVCRPRSVHGGRVYVPCRHVSVCPQRGQRCQSHRDRPASARTCSRNARPRSMMFMGSATTSVSDNPTVTESRLVRPCSPRHRPHTR